jgi:integrase
VPWVLSQAAKISPVTCVPRSCNAASAAVPYDLRHRFASLMFHEQRKPLEIADMMGHSPQVLFSTYAHVIAELRGTSPTSADEQIRAVRSGLQRS